MLYIKIKSLNNFVKDGWTQRNDLFIVIKSFYFELDNIFF